MSIIDIATTLRKKYMSSIKDITDPGYYILKAKTSSLSKDESEFVEIYENTFALHSLSIIATIPGTIYFYHYYRSIKSVPADEKRLKWARRGVFIFSPLAIALVSTAWLYEKKSGFEKRLKEVESFYLENKDKDINSISFGYKVEQSL